MGLHTYLTVRKGFSADLGGSVGFASDWWLGGRGFDPRRVRQHSFVKIDLEIFSKVIPPLPVIIFYRKNVQKYWLTAKRTWPVLEKCGEMNWSARQNKTKKKNKKKKTNGIYMLQVRKLELQSLRPIPRLIRYGRIEMQNDVTLFLLVFLLQEHICNKYDCK